MDIPWFFCVVQVFKNLRIFEKSDTETKFPSISKLFKSIEIEHSIFHDKISVKCLNITGKNNEATISQISM